jgi:hypothetical protein
MWAWEPTPGDIISPDSLFPQVSRAAKAWLALASLARSEGEVPGKIKNSRPWAGNAKRLLSYAYMPDSHVQAFPFYV